jgi:hypothetical protein
MCAGVPPGADWSRRSGSGPREVTFPWLPGREWSENPLHRTEGSAVLWTIIIVLLILWALGFVTNFLGSLIHLLLVIAVIVVLLRIIRGQKPI